MAPTSTRSSSISSASTSASKSTVDGIKKKFGCSHPGCGKSFSRSEHLHRHALNHKDGNNTCLRCSAHFRRRDLLDRHMARHKEKDDEAGGEGLGVLATRKRLWRDTDGKIVNARRPSYAQHGAKRRQLSQSDRKSSRSSEDDRRSSQGPIILDSFSSSAIPMSRNGSTASTTIVVETKGARFQEHEDSQKLEDLEQDSWLGMSALPSPPTSDSSIASAAHSPTAEIAELDTLYEDSWPTMHHGLPQIVNNSPVLGRQSDYPESPSWGPQPFTTFMGAMADQPYEDMFKPETGIYDWQAWNNQVLMSRCRDEKFESFERKREWGPYSSPESSFRRAYGLGGTC